MKIGATQVSIGQLTKYAIYYLSWGSVKDLPSPIGEPLRFAVLKMFLGKLGNSSFRIREGVTIHMPERVRIGEHTTLNEWVFIDGEGGVEIGDWVRIAHRSSFLSANHGFESTLLPMALQPHRLGKIVVEDDVWIGADVKVLRGVHIGRGSIIGAGAVVTRDVPEFSVAVGVPARVVSARRGCGSSSEEAKAASPSARHPASE